MKLNMKLNVDEVVAAIVEMEGKSLITLAGNDTLAGLREWWSGRRVPATYCVYGSGGVHRYFVREDGRVQYSVRHGGWPDVSGKAKALGFDLLV
jgi:hypothetical protein